MIEKTSLGRIAVPPGVPPGFALFYTTRDIDGRLDEDAARRLTQFIEQRFAIACSLTTCNQVHGATVCRAGSQPAHVLSSGGLENPPHIWSEPASCDALFSSAPHTALGIKVADCLPVTMVDPVHSVIANIHSGWRGAVQRITAATLDTLLRETAFDPRSARAFLGPTIRVCCFEVGEEVASQFNERYVDRSYPKPHLDIPAFTKNILRAGGFADDAIIDTELCTRCDGSIFHSFRRDPKSGGRNLAVVAQ